MRNTFGLIVIVALLCSARARADADEAPAVESSHLSVKLGLGFGGTIDAISSATVVQNSAAVADSQAQGLRVSYGFGAQYTVPLARHFALGATLGYLSWRGASGWTIGARNWLLDAAILPEVRLKLADSVLLYMTIPLGISLDVLHEIESDDGSRALGFLMGLLVGARIHIVDSFGLFGELGYVFRRFSHELSFIELSSMAGPTSVRQDVTVAFGQLAINAGACVYF